MVQPGMLPVSLQRSTQPLLKLTFHALTGSLAFEDDDQYQVQFAGIKSFDGKLEGVLMEPHLCNFRRQGIFLGIEHIPEPDSVDGWFKGTYTSRRDGINRRLRNQFLSFH